MKKTFIVIFVIVFCQLKSYSQTEIDGDYNIRTIHLEIGQSQMIPYHKVKLVIKYLRSNVTVSVESTPSDNNQAWDYSKINETFELPIEDFLEIKNSLEKIEIKNMFKGAEYLFLDGYNCYLTYGGNGGTVCLQFQSPTSRTQERGLNEYLDACILILKKARLDDTLIKEILHIKTL